MADISYYKTSDHNVSIVCGRGVSKRFPMHRHLTISVGMVIKGSRALTIHKNKYILGHGDIFIINSGEPHAISESMQDEHDYIVVSINPSILPEPYEKAWFLNIIESQVLATEMKLLYQYFIENRIPNDFQSHINTIIEELIKFKMTKEIHSSSDARLKRIKELLDQFPDTDISLEELADKAFLSMFHFSRLFKKHTGLAPHRYQLDSRLRLARNLLERQLPIGDVAIMAGFYDTSHFVRHFQQYYGVTPNEFQKGMQTISV